MTEKENGAKRLSKYMDIQSEPVHPDRLNSPLTKEKEAIRLANIAEGKPGTDFASGADYVTSEAEGLISKYGKEQLRKSRQKVDELADQYKRETRGVKDDSIRGKIREMTGMKKGGKVKSASSRADGIAKRGKTRGMMK